MMTYPRTSPHTARSLATLNVFYPYELFSFRILVLIRSELAHRPTGAFAPAISDFLRSTFFDCARTDVDFNSAGTSRIHAIMKRYLIFMASLLVLALVLTVTLFGLVQYYGLG